MSYGYYITKGGEKGIIDENQPQLHSCSITEVSLNVGIHEFNCSWNNLTELVLPDRVKNLYCSNNKLTKIILCDGIEIVNCNYNYN